MVMAILYGILLRLAGLAMSVVLMWSVPPQWRTTIVPIDQNNLMLQFSVISDVHMQDETYRKEGLAKALTDIGASKQRQDALILLGDNTANGAVKEYISLYGIVSHYNRARNTLTAIGNHDINRGVLTLEEATTRHNTFLRAYTGIHTDKPYYSQEINGYTFIVLGDEGPYRDARATLSNTQLRWLKKQLDAAKQSGKPIFVFNHQPLNHTFPNYAWGGVGPQSESLRVLLNKYKNIFFFSGHVHTKATKLKIMQNGGVTYVDVPTLLSKEPHGVGYQVEAYENQVVLRARNYITGEWVEKNQYTIALS